MKDGKDDSSMDGMKRAAMAAIRLLCPVLIYDMIIWLVYVAATILFGTSGEDYSSSISIMAAGAVIALVPLGLWYRHIRNEVRDRNIKLSMVLILIITGAGCSIFFNYFLSMFPALNTTYEETAEVLYQPGFWEQILYLVVLIPFAEEMIFRGLGYYQLRRDFAYLPAALISSLYFALYHGNLKQGIYAFFVGMIVATAYEVYDTLIAAWIFHMAANATSVVMQNSQWNGNSVFLLLAGGVLMIFGLYKIREDGKQREITIHSNTLL